MTIFKIEKGKNGYVGREITSMERFSLDEELLKMLEEDRGGKKKDDRPKDTSKPKCDCGKKEPHNDSPSDKEIDEFAEILTDKVTDKVLARIAAKLLTMTGAE